jgi:hypothetical protein
MGMDSCGGKNWMKGEELHQYRATIPRDEVMRTLQVHLEPEGGLFSLNNPQADYLRFS